MEIILLILKIIGWILLITAGLLLILLCIPIGFRGEMNASGKENISGEIKVSYLFHGILFLLIYKEKKLNGILRLFKFIQIQVLGKSDEKEKTDKPGKEEAPDGNKEKSEAPENSETGDAEKENEEESETTSLKAKKDAFIEFINDPKVRETYDFLKPRILRILRSLLPRKVEGNLEFGMESPDTTGRIAGVLGALFPVTHSAFKIIPCFTEERLQGQIKFKGHWCLLLILIRLLIILLNKNIHYTYKKAKKLWRK